MLDDLRALCDARPRYTTLVTVALVWALGFSTGVMFLAVVLLLVKAGV